MKKLILFLTVIFATLALLVSCGTGGAEEEGGGETGENSGSVGEKDEGSEDENGATEVAVRVIVKGEGLSVASSIYTVKEGDTLEIPINFDEGYTFGSASVEGEYDYERSVYVISPVTLSISRVEFEAKQTERFDFTSHLEEGDEVSIENGNYAEGVTVTVKSKNTDATFIGWTFGRSFADGGAIVSGSKEFSFKIGREYSKDKSTISIFANYTTGNVYYYDVNGGEVNISSTNMSDTTYYTATVNGDTVQVVLGARYFEVVGTASTFYDDATFTREGYVLVEYNTKPDGTGEGYNTGAKFDISSAEGTPTLYCIWQKEADQQSFTYREVSNTRPGTAQALPHWQTSGLQITEYLGNERIVAIPNKIGDQYVISIDTGAFKNKDVETVIFGRYVLEVKDGAFVNCDKIKTIYYSDGITYATDNFLDDASKKNFKELRINAVMPPKRTNDQWAGRFAIKLTRVMSTADTRRVIMFGGSSVYEGMSSTYMEALLNGGEGDEFSFINFGIVRHYTIMFYIDAIDHYTKEGDVVIMSPENHVRAMGDTTFDANSIGCAEGMYPSLMRYIDASRYSRIFTSLSEFNRNRAGQAPTRYEELCKVENGRSAGHNRYGDQLADYNKRSIMRNQVGCVGYTDTYMITFNDRIKSNAAPNWTNENAATQDWKDPNNVTWCSFTEPQYKDQVNRMIREINATGAMTCFSYAPVDGTGVPGSAFGVIPEVKADAANWLSAYDALIEETYYEYDAYIGCAANYIFHHNYFFDSAYHLNNYGRALWTYQLYTDLCIELGIDDVNGYLECGTDFEGCMFEAGVTDGKPTYKVDYIEEIKN